MLIDNDFDWQNLTSGQIADAIGRSREYTNAFTAIEELMVPADHTDRHDLRFVGRDELSSLIRVVNSGLRRHIQEIETAVQQLKASEKIIAKVRK